MALEAFFMPRPDGARFCILHKTRAGEPRGSVVYVHPFFEEMNKSRRVVAKQCRALADIGYDVLQVDLQGCGDSSGNFESATWAGWVEDVLVACQWMRHRSPAPLWLWGLRGGSLVAHEALCQLEQPAAGLLLWQPVAAGKVALQQFLRLAAAGDLQGGKSKAVMDELRLRLRTGQPVVVAGYNVNAELANAMESAALQPAPSPGRMVWIETASQPAADLSPAATSRCQAWRDAGWTVDARVVSAPAFWQTAYLEDAPLLVAETTAAMGGGGLSP